VITTDGLMIVWFGYWPTVPWIN